MAGADAENIRVAVSRDLKLSDVVGLGVGAMVGAGVFILLAPATHTSGLSILLALGLSGLVVLLSALSYAELATVFPNAGGGYAWAKKGLPAPFGFLTGWIAWLGHSTAIALSAAGLSAFALFGIGIILSIVEVIDISSLLAEEVYVWVLKTGALVVVLGFLSLSGLRSRRAQRRRPISLLVKLALFIAFLAVVVISAVTLQPSNSAPQYDFFGIQGWAGIPLAIGFIFVAFEGYEIIALSSQEIKNPAKTIPKGILISIGLVLLLYFLLEGSLLSLAREGCFGSLATCALEGPRAELSLPMLVHGSLGWGIGLLTIVAGIVAMVTAVSNNFASATRLSYTMVKEGDLPSQLSEAGTRTHSSARTLIVSGALAMVLILMLDIIQLAIVAGILYLTLFAFVNVSLVSIRRKREGRPNGFRTPLVPVVPIIGLLINLVLAVYLLEFPAINPGSIPPGRIAWSIVLLWVTIGMFYHFFSGGKEQLRRLDVKGSRDISEMISSEEQEIDLKRYRVFVPLKDFSDINTVKFGAYFAKEKMGELSLLNVVEIPRNLPPSAIRFSYVNDRIKELDRLTKMTRREGVDTRASVKIGHKVHEIIIDTMSEEEVNLLVLGWRGGREAPGKILGSNIDYIVDTAPCDVVVLKTKKLKESIRKILLIAGPSFAVEEISEITYILAKCTNAELKLLVVGGHGSEVDATLKNLQPFISSCGKASIKVTITTSIARNIEPEIRRESSDCDLVLINSPRRVEIRRLMLSPLEQRLARIIDGPVMLFRKGIAKDQAS